MDHKHWVANIQGKISEIQGICFRILSGSGSSGPTSNRSASLQLLSGALSGLRLMYAKGQAPKLIGDLENAAKNFVASPSSRELWEELYGISNLLPQIVGDANSYISFHDIFESYKSEDSLGELFDHLVECIQIVLDESDEFLNARAQRDLERLLNQLRSRGKMSTYEVAAWAEIAAKIVLEILGQKVGIPCVSSLVDIVKTANKIRKATFDSYQIAQNECVLLLDLKGVSKPFQSLPELNDQTVERLESESSQNIES